MTIPAVVRIGAIDYDVKMADNITPNSGDANDFVLGEINYAPARIYLQHDQNPQVMKQTLLHEIVHGILHQAGQETSELEPIIIALGYGLNALIQSNPALIAYIQEAVTDV